MRSAWFAKLFMKPLTPRPFVVDVAFVVGMPYIYSTQAGVIAVLLQGSKGTMDDSVNGMETAAGLAEGFSNLLRLQSD